MASSSSRATDGEEEIDFLFALINYDGAQVARILQRRIPRASLSAHLPSGNLSFDLDGFAFRVSSFHFVSVVPKVTNSANFSFDLDGFAFIVSLRIRLFLRCMT